MRVRDYVLDRNFHEPDAECFINSRHSAFLRVVFLRFRHPAEERLPLGGVKSYYYTFSAFSTENLRPKATETGILRHFSPKDRPTRPKKQAEMQKRRRTKDGGSIFHGFYKTEVTDLICGV